MKPFILLSIIVFTNVTNTKEKIDQHERVTKEFISL
jgi:hypothetical protein